MENTNGTKNGRDLFLVNKPLIVPWGTERMLQRIQSHRRNTLHWSAHPQREQDKMEKSGYGMDWLQKGIWYGPIKLDNKLSENVQNIRWSRKLYQENLKTWRVKLTTGGRSLIEAKIERSISKGHALSPLLFIIAMMPLKYILRKCTTGYKLTKSQEKINHLMYMDDIKLFAKKWNRIGNFDTRSENIQSGHKDGIWHRKMCHTSNEK